MNDEPLLRDRLRTLAGTFYKAVTKGKEEDLDEGVLNWFVNDTTKLFNEHSKTTAILSGRERHRLTRLQKILDYKRKRLELRDPAEVEAKKKEKGEFYNDFLVADISALDWIIDFVKKHSV